MHFSEWEMCRFSGVAAADFTGGSPAERIPPSARYNPHCPVFNSPPPDESRRLSTATPPRNQGAHHLKGPLDSRDPNTQRPTSRGPQHSDAKQSFWSGADISGIIYGGQDELSAQGDHQYASSTMGPASSTSDLLDLEPPYTPPRPLPSFQSYDEYQPVAPPSPPRLGAPVQPGAGMEQNLIQWAIANGLTIPPAPVRDGVASTEPQWPAFAYRPADPTEFESKPSGLSEYTPPLEARSYDYSILPAEMATFSLSFDSRPKEGFHQRARIRQEMKEKIKAGNGDIITWTNNG